MSVEPVLDAGTPPLLPLELRLLHSDQPLLCETLLRYLPQKRWVCGGRWGGRSVVAKIFLDRQRCKRHWLRERRGARMLKERGIPTAELLHAERLPGARAFVTIFERVEGVSGAEVWNGTWDAAARQAFLSSVVMLLVEMHRVGLQQQDPHLENLRSVDDALLVLDGATVTASRKPLEPRRGLDNLALQLVEFLGLAEDEVEALYRIYCQHRGLDAERHSPLFARLHQRQRRYHVRKNVDKAFRSCTAFVAHRDSEARWVYDRRFDSRDLRAFLGEPERYVERAQPEMVKDGNSATVWRVKMDGRSLAVKRYNIKNATHGLRRAVSRSRAARSWEGAQRLRLLEIPTPRAVAFVERRLGALRRTAWLVTEWVEGKPAAEYFVRAPGSGEADSRMAQQLVAIIERLGREGILHGDLKATNFLIGPRGPVLIDLDAMRTRNSGRDWRRGRKRDLDRFRRNWPDPIWNDFFARPFAERQL